MIPALYVELESLPLTPNGKVDRQALPLPDFDTLSIDLEMPNDDVEATLIELWKEIFHIKRVGIDDNFFDLGGDSLIASVLFVEIDRRFGRLYPLSLLIEKNTIRKLAEVLRDSGTGITHSLVVIKAEGERLPLFIIPGGYGDTLYLRKLAKYIHPEQPLYGIQSADPDENQQYLPRVEEIAAQYLMEIAEVQPHGPYLLGGHSFGGYVALEMARLLLKRGEQVALLVMIDTYPPGQRKKASLKSRFLIHYDNLRPLNGKQRLDYMTDRWAQLVFRFSRNGRLSGFLRRTISPSKRHFAVSRMARYNYNPAPYPGNLLLIQASERPPYMTWDPMENWSDYIAGKLDIIPVSGEHATLLFEPYVKVVAEAINNKVARILARQDHDVT
jgi:thioesterase domain-containing protein/acyl carrier protein